MSVCKQSNRANFPELPAAPVAVRFADNGQTIGTPSLASIGPGGTGLV